MVAAHMAVGGTAALPVSGQEVHTRSIRLQEGVIELAPVAGIVAVRFAEDVPDETKPEILTARLGVADPQSREAIANPRMDVFDVGAADEALARLDALTADARVEYATRVYRSEGIEVIPLDELFVQLRNQTDPAAMDAIRGEFHLELVRATEWRAGNYVLRVTGASPGDSIAVAQEVGRRPGVDFCHPNFIRKMHKLDVPADPLFVDQWGLHNTRQIPRTNEDCDLDAPEAWCISQGCEMVIAILDEGCDMTHPDLNDKYDPGRAYDAVDRDNRPQPNPWDAHGTACAGIAAAETNNFGVAGVNWHARIMPIRIAYSPFPGANYWITTDGWLSDSIAWAYRNGADVLSNSWGGGPPSDQIHAAIRDATLFGRGGKGAVVVFAAGNENRPVPHYPGRYDETICVAATSPCDERKSPGSCDGENWWGSNYGAETDVAAPGVKITTTDIQGADGYGPGDYYATFNGTSAATPFVAGVAGMVICKYPDYTEMEVRGRIEQTCDKVGNVAYDATTGKSFDLGHGRVNLYRALSGKPQVILGPLPDFPSVYRDASDAFAAYPGTHHDSAACDWLGEEFSPEVDEVDPDDPDGKENEEHADAFDDGVTLFPPYRPGERGDVAVTVSVENSASSRYAGGLLYVNVWIDWQSDDDWNNTYDWVVQNEPVNPSTWGRGVQSMSFVYSFTVPSFDVDWHLQSDRDGRFLNVRTRLTYKQRLTTPDELADFGEVEDDYILNFVEMFKEDLGYLSIKDYGCTNWMWLSGLESWTCHPPFIGNPVPPTGYASAEIYVGPPDYHFHSGLLTPIFDLSELTEAFLEYDFSAVEPVTGFVHVYKNGVLDATPVVYPMAPLALCNVFHEVVDLTPWCGEGNDQIQIEFKTYPPGVCPPDPPDYQDWKLDNVVVWGRDVIAPADAPPTVTPTGETSHDIEWTTPGDDDVEDTAEVFNLRYGPKAIDASNWRHSMWVRKVMVGSLPVPGPPGTVVTLAVAAMSPGQHFFSVRTLDEVNNLSGVGPGGQNRAPTVTTPARVSVIAGETLSFVVTAADADLDPLVLLATAIPTGATFKDAGGGIGRFRWETEAADIGTYTADFEARDPNGATGAATTRIEVERSGRDCNRNGVDDTDDIINGTSKDCNRNGWPDECDIDNGTSEDCNNNGRPDECDIADGTSRDDNNNRIPDECECIRNPAWVCDGDVDGNGAVNPVDVGLIQAAFGSTHPRDLCQYDMDCNDAINPVDSGIVQSLFGACNPPRGVCP
jgi:hypothetical protein